MENVKEKLELNYPYDLVVKTGDIYTGEAFESKVDYIHIGSEIDPIELGNETFDGYEEIYYIVKQQGKFYLIVQRQETEDPNSNMTTWLGCDWEAYELPEKVNLDFVSE